MVVLVPRPYRSQPYSFMQSQRPPKPAASVPINRASRSMSAVQNQTGAPQAMAMAHCRQDAQKSRMQGSVAHA